MNRETRYLQSAELRAEFGAKPKIAGYAVVYNQLSEIMGGLREVIRPGCFTESLPTADIRALINHETHLVLARNKAGTLRLFDDPHGLRFEIDPPATTYAQDLMESIRRGDISACSFGFFDKTPVGDRIKRDQNEGALRQVTKADIFDVSICTIPAYPQTEVAVRCLQEWQKEEEKKAAKKIFFNNWLRLQGVSNDAK